MKKIYLDYASSTLIDAKVLQEMMPYLKKEFGNPSSTHGFGQKARAAVEKAREKVAKFLNCAPLEVIFTSGATEANNFAIQGIARKFEIRNSKSETNTKYKIQNTKSHVIISQIEHESMLFPCQELERQGLAEVTYVGVDSEGIVRVEEIEKALKENTALVSIMYANSEIGTIEPIAEIGEMLRKFEIRNSKSEINPKSKIQNTKILFHTDAVQAAQFLDCDVKKLGVDLLTLSGHKIYAPKGVGVLYVKEGVMCNPLLLGGGQEQGFRSGTENVASIVGMGRAIEEIQNPRTNLTNIKIRQLRDKFIKEVLRKIPESSLAGSKQKRLPNNGYFLFKGIENRALAMALDQKGIAVSTGSACSEKTQEPSHVILALGVSFEDAMSGLRVTFGKYTTVEEIEKATAVLVAVVAQLRKNRV